MTTFLHVLAVVAWFAVFFAVIIAGVVVPITLVTDGYIALGLAAAAGALVITAGLITIPVSLGVFETDNSRHCGPGTRYHEYTYINSGGESESDWRCEPDSITKPMEQPK